jgi:hypothetical protein
MTQPLIGVVTNPNSRKNRLNPQRYERMRETVGELGLVRRTPDVSAIAAVVSEFLDRGVSYLVADGGDGAFHWLMNVTAQVLDSRLDDGKPAAWPAILPTNAGTIDFIGRKAGVIGHCDSLLPALTALLHRGDQPGVVHLQTLRCRGTYGPDADLPGQAFDRLGFAAALAGIGQRFFDKFYAHDRQDAVGIAYLVGKTLASQASRSPPLKWLPVPAGLRWFSEPVFEPLPARVWVDGAELPQHLYRDLDIGSIDINIANLFRFFALAGDGERLHLQCGYLGAADVLRNLPRMMRGQPLAIDGYVQQAVEHLRVVPDAPATLDPCIDGELFWGLVDLEVSRGPSVPVVQLQA